MLLHGVVEEESDSVCWDGEGDSSCNLQGVDANHLPVLQGSRITTITQIAGIHLAHSLSEVAVASGLMTLAEQVKVNIKVKAV